MEGVNSTMIYYKNFCKCHNAPLVNNNNNNNVIIMIMTNKKQNFNNRILNSRIFSFPRKILENMLYLCEPCYLRCGSPENLLPQPCHPFLKNRKINSRIVSSHGSSPPTSTSLNFTKA
jgi:hypothetical protein